MTAIVFAIVLAAVGLLILTVYMYREAHADRVVSHELVFPKFPLSFQEITIFFISDIHRRTISPQIIEQAQGKVDFVIIGGDLLEKGVPLERVEENLQKLQKLGPVYFVWGNNDYEINEELLRDLFRSYHVKILENTAEVFQSETGEHFVLMGVDDVGEERDRLDLALEQAETEGFKVLVSHNPAIIHKVQEEHEIKLVLSGHTHGGQIRIFGFGPYEKGGIKIVNNTVLFVSEGYGTTWLPLRLGTKAETHLISLKRGSVGNIY